MLTVLCWIAFCFAFVGASAVPFGLIARNNAVLFVGIVSLAVGVGLFGIWTTATISGFMGAVCALVSATLMISLLTSNHSSAQRHDARAPSNDFES